MILLCETDDLDEGVARGYERDGRSLIVVQWEGRYSVFENQCPHLEIELNMMPDAFMDDDSRYLICANHGALFEPDSGLCVFGPCQGQSLRTIEHTVVDGAIFI